MDMKTLKKLGREHFGSACRLCANCDGKVCAGEIPGAGGVASGASFKNNFEDLAKVQLRLRIVHEVHKPDCSFDLWGHKLAMPILAAPIGGIQFNWNNYINESEYCKHVIAGCKMAGAMGMTGDGKMPEIYGEGIEAIVESGGFGIPTIKPRPNELIIEKAAIAEKAGAVAVAVDVDAAALINITSSGQPVGPKSFNELVELKKNINLPLIIKGVMDPEDALAIAEAGIDGIVVSNHGGRVLDHTPGTAAVLPAIAKALEGKNMTIFVDGGIRTGFDVIKMLALGADAVLVGRPVTQAAVGGAEGVACLMNHLKSQMEAGMIMTGSQTLADITDRVIYKG